MVRRVKKLVLGTFCVLVGIIISCAAWFYFAFVEWRPVYYISLEEAENVVVTRTVDWGEFAFWEGGIIPVRYKLERKDYIVLFSIESGIILTMEIWLDNPKNEHSYIEPDIGKQPFARIIDEKIPPGGITCARKFHSLRRTPTVISFDWSPFCVAPEYRKVLDFTVVDETGKIIGKESIPFQIIEHGQIYSVNFGL